MPSKVLFLDDRWKEEHWDESLSEWMPDGVEVIYEERGNRAIQRLKENPEVKLVFLDLRFEGQPEQGEEVLNKIKEQYPELRVIILSSINDIQLALRLVHKEKKAYYYFHKESIDFDQLKKLIEITIETYDLRAEAIRKTDIGLIIGDSRALLEVLRLAEQASCVDSTVLITGESGTGKELIARSIHLNSNRRKKPFVAVNCGAIPENLIESELFGHVRGSFTTAIADKRGIFERADKGTVFLDEIAELKVELQVRLLRVLQLGEFTRVGSETAQKVDARVIAATNKNLEDRITQGLFRDDLFWRLNVIRIKMPPLRERKEDIPALLSYIVQRLNEKLGRSKDVSDEAIDILRRHDWAGTGNIRELENILEAAIVTTRSDIIGASEIETLITPESKSADRGADIEKWVEMLLESKAEWEDVRKEFGASGDNRKRIMVGIISSMKQKSGRRPTGAELAGVIKIPTRNHLNQVLSNLGLKLKDF